MRLPDNTPLLALVDASAEVQAGIPPHCSASVRLLDRVHFTVHGGDCVVVHHEDPAGARVLLAALAGSPALVPGRMWRGRRHCAPHVRVRRAAIRAASLDALLEGWRDLDAGRNATRALPFEQEVLGDHPPAVHLLRASRAGRATESELRQWRTWARRERASGGAVVIVARPSESPLPSLPTRPQLVAEQPLPAGSAESYLTPSLREVLLRHGRLFNVRAWS
jgi:hypothetical protein